MTTLSDVIQKYRELHQQYIQRAINSRLTQEYRTWHHVMAETLDPLLRELEQLVVPEASQQRKQEDPDDEMPMVEFLEMHRRPKKP